MRRLYVCFDDRVSLRRGFSSRRTPICGICRQSMTYVGRRSRAVPDVADDAAWSHLEWKLQPLGALRRHAHEPKGK